jgi:hypothetical protein
MKQTQDRALTEEVRKARQPIGIAEVAHGDIHRRGPLHDQITHSYQFSNSNIVAGVTEALAIPNSDRSGVIPYRCRGR